MNHSPSVGASIRKTCEAIIMAKPVDIITGKPTTETTNLLEHQLSQADGAVTNNRWGGLKVDYQVVTGVGTATVSREAKAALVNPSVNTNTTHYERMVKQKEPEMEESGQ